MSPRTGSAPAVRSASAEASERVSARTVAPVGEQPVEHRPADEAAGAGDEKGVGHGTRAT